MRLNYIDNSIIVYYHMTNKTLKINWSNNCFLHYFEQLLQFIFKVLLVIIYNIIFEHP